MTTHHASQADVLVVGGGIIGLALGWRLAERGRRVTVVERDRAGRGASYAAAGMLAPAVEIQFEETELYALGRASLRRWPAFARDLERASGHDVGYRDEGTLVVADDRDAAEALRRLYRFQQSHGVPVEWLTGREALEIEPFLSPKLAAAVWSPEDHQVDNRRVVDALREAIAQAPTATLREGATVRAVEPHADAPAVVTDDGERIEASAVVLAAGAWLRGIDGIEPKPPVRPVKGQMLALRLAAPFDLRHVVRGPDAYLAPKADGRLVIGATSEELGFDTRVTAGGLFRLLEGAVEVVPGVEELEVVETWAGLRPASRDHAPLLGRAAPGVVLAAGHYRHGILLAPATADELSAGIDAMLGGGDFETSPLLAPFSPQRFDAPASAR
jgi:glycine oxidase